MTATLVIMLILALFAVPLVWFALYRVGALQAEIHRRSQPTWQSGSAPVRKRD